MNFYCFETIKYDIFSFTKDEPLALNSASPESKVEPVIKEESSEIWKLLMPAFVSTMTEFVGIVIMQPILIYYVQTFTDENIYVGINLSVYSGASFIGTICIGRFSDRYGRRPAMILSIWGTCIGYFLWGISWDVYALIAMRTFAGLSSNTGPILKTYISEIAPDNQQSLYNGYVLATQCILSMTLPLLTLGLYYGSHLIVESEQMRYRGIFFLCGLITLVAAFWIIYSVPEVPKENRKIKCKGTNGIRMVPTALLCIAGFFSSNTYAIATSILAIILEDVYGYQHWVYIICMPIGMGTSILLIIYFTKKFVLPKRGTFGTSILYSVFSSWANIVMAFCMYNNLIAKILFWPAASFSHLSFFTFQTIYPVIIRTYSTSDGRNSAMALLQTSKILSFVIFPPLLIIIYDHYGPITMYMFLAIIQFIPVAICLYLWYYNNFYSFETLE